MPLFMIFIFLYVIFCALCALFIRYSVLTFLVLSTKSFENTYSFICKKSTNRVYSVFDDPPLCTKYAQFCHSHSDGYLIEKVLHNSALACPPFLKLTKDRDFLPFVFFIASFETVCFFHLVLAFCTFNISQ